jgi:N-methylhydantoinase A
VVLGRLNQHALVGGTFPIDAGRSRDAIQKLAEHIELSIEETAAGIVRIVDAQMAKVLRIVTVERGLDPREFAMVAFGGNGPLHGAALAEELGITRVIVPRDPGVFSAHGLLVAELRANFVRPILRETPEIQNAELETIFAELQGEGRRILREQGAEDRAMTFTREYDARYRGQSFELDIQHEGSVSALEQRFHDKHQQRYGYAVNGEPVELVNARLTAVGRLAPLRVAAPAPDSQMSSQIDKRNVWIDGRYVAAPVFARERLAPNATILGPALVEQYDTCTYVPPTWSARNEGAMLVLERDHA